MNALYGDTVKHVRGNRNLTQSELAELAHVSRQTIASIENGSHDVKLSSLEQVLDALSLSLSIAAKPSKPIENPSGSEYEQIAAEAVARYFG